MLHSMCLFLKLCQPPVSPKGTAVSKTVEEPFDQHKAFIEYWRGEGFSPPTEEEPDGHIPMDYIFHYDPWGRLPEWWMERDGDSWYLQHPRQKDSHKI